MFNLDTPKFRWIALVVLSLSLAIVIIDNTVLNVAIPYIIKDLKTSVDGIQWVVSGYALIIATLLITVGRLGDIFGRKLILIIGIALFAVGSFIASISGNVFYLFIGEALIEAVGAAMMLTSSLSLIASEFEGKERAIAFGVWGSIAGASASIGPLLGGYFTTYYSWRWSLRINIFVAIIAILGSVFIKEAKGVAGKGFDWLGTFLSGFGLFSLVFGLIEGQKYGWLKPNEMLKIGGWSWPLSSFSIIPIAFVLAVVLLILFVLWEMLKEKKGGSPLLKMSMFKNLGFSIGLTTIGIVSLGQFGVFFVLPIFLQNVLGLNALQTGFVFLWSSVTILIFGPLSGFIASKIGTKWVVSTGMFILALGAFVLINSLNTTTTGWSLGPALILFGIGVGVPSAQITNAIISSVDTSLAGEASAANATIRQVGTSLGIAIIGAVLASSVTANIKNNIQADLSIPEVSKTQIVQNLKNVPVVSKTSQQTFSNQNPILAQSIKADVNQSLVDSSRDSLKAALIFILLGAAVSLLIPNNNQHKQNPWKKEENTSETPQATMISNH